MMVPSRFESPFFVHHFASYTFHVLKRAKSATKNETHPSKALFETLET